MKVVKITELQKQMAMIAIATAVFLSLGVFAVVFPGLQRINKLQNQVIDVGRKEEFLSQIEMGQTKITEAQSWMTEKKNRHFILTYLRSIAKKYGVQVDIATLDPIEEGDKLGYSPLIARLEVRSDFKGLFSLGVELGEKNPKIVIDELHLTLIPRGERQAAQGANRSLKTELVLRTLLLPENDAVKSLGAK